MNLNNLIKYVLYMLHDKPEQDVRVNDLNCILYDAWVNYHKRTCLRLFDEWFLVYDDGPMLPTVKRKYGSINRVIVTKQKRPVINDNDIELSVIDAISNYYNNADAKKPEYRKAWAKANIERVNDFLMYPANKDKDVYSIPEKWMIEEDCCQMNDGIIVCVDYYNGIDTVPHYFKVPDANFDLIAELQKAIREFAQTPDGKEFMKDYYSFNWADVEPYLSQELLMKHHIEIVKPYSKMISVNADSALLCDSDLEEME